MAVPPTARETVLSSPPASVKRSFTLPASLQSSPARWQNSSCKGPETQAIETLFVHPNGLIVHFTLPDAGPSQRRSLEEQEAVGGLPWKSRTERTLAAGYFRIYRVPGSVTFLNAGTSFLKPVLARSQCWCVDGQRVFVLKRGSHDYYRIELPCENEEDRRAIDSFRDVLNEVAKFEKTPCPFKRGFQVELPESPQITYVPWKPKHRPISPERRTSVVQSPADSPNDRMRRRARVEGSSRSSSEGTRTPAATEYSLSPALEYSHQASIKPTIGKFEVLDKDHQREQLIWQGRPQSSHSPEEATPSQQSPQPADYNSSPIPYLGRSPQRLAPARLEHAKRNFTAPPAIILQSLEKLVVDTQADVRVALAASPDAATSQPAERSRSASSENTFTAERERPSTGQGTSNDSAATSAPAASDCTSTHDRRYSEQSTHLSGAQLASLVEESALSVTSESAASYDAIGEDALGLYSPPPERAGHISPISTLGSLPDFGFDTDNNDDITEPYAPKDDTMSTLGEILETTHLSLDQEDLGEPDTPVWHSASEGTDVSTGSSVQSSSTGASYATAPEVPAGHEIRVSQQLPASTSPAPASRPQTKPQARLQVPALRRQRSLSPMSISTNLYVSHQDRYEHIGAMIGEKMAGAILGPPLQLAAIMLRIAAKFTDGVRIRDGEGRGWERRGEKGRRLPGTWESYSEDEGDIMSDFETDYGISDFGMERE